MSIAQDLGARFGTSATVHCESALGVPAKCKATLADGTELPIAISNASATEWGWNVDGVVVERAVVQPYVESSLASVHASQTVDCGRPVQVIRAGDQIACKLGAGGVALVTVRADGSTSLELDLDPASAIARTELPSPDRDRELERESKALENRGVEGRVDIDEEAETPPSPDAGSR
jgi:hypothetical protein